MKKLFALPIAAALVMGLAACGGSTGPGDDKGSDAPKVDAEGTPELLIWVDTTREPAVKAYQESVGDTVNVKYEVVDQQTLPSKIQLFNTTGEGWPDVIFAGNPNDIASWADPANGYAAKLNDLVDPKIFEGYGNANQWCEIDGDFYCLKNDLAQTVLWYDTVIFEELGLTVPTTMDEFAAEAMKLEGTGYIAGPIGDGTLYQSYLWPSQCPMNTVTALDTVKNNPEAEECTRVAELVQPLLDAGVVDSRGSFDAGFLSEVAQQGKIAMAMAPSWFGEFVFKSEENWNVPEGRIAAAEMPKWEGNDVAYSGEGGGGIWAVSDHAKFPQAAADAAVFMATDLDLMKDAVTYPAYGPALEGWKDAISADPYYASDIIPAMAAQADRIGGNENPVRYESNSATTGVLSVELMGGAKVADAMAKFQENLSQLAKASGYTVVTE